MYIDYWLQLRSLYIVKKAGMKLHIDQLPNAVDTMLEIWWAKTMGNLILDKGYICIYPTILLEI